VGERKNWVAEACERVGGAQKASEIAGVRLGTMYGWRRQGYIHLLGPALRLARASRIPVERFGPPEAQAD